MESDCKQKDEAVSEQADTIRAPHSNPVSSIADHAVLRSDGAVCEARADRKLVALDADRWNCGTAHACEAI